MVVPLMVAGTSCHLRTGRMVDEIKGDLDSLKLIYAPDTRTALWTAGISHSRGKVTLDGEVAQNDAYLAIIESVTARLPDIGMELKLLPEKEPERQVNGLVNHSVVNLRAAPSHRAEMVTQALLGTPIRILKEEGGWSLVQTPNRYLGWLEDVVFRYIGEEEIGEYRLLDKVVFTFQHGLTYSEPDPGSRPVSDLVAGCILPVLEREKHFLKVVYPNGRVAWVRGEETADTREHFGLPHAGGDLAETALSFNGIPYQWGGTSPKSFDCSGLSFLVYYLNGILLPRDADQQSRCGRVVSTDYRPEGLVPGDLLFFGRRATADETERVTHVGIYIGDTEFIHASAVSGSVGINSMDPGRENYLPDYPAIFVRSVRIIGEPAFEEGPRGFEPVSGNAFYQQIISFNP